MLSVLSAYNVEIHRDSIYLLKDHSCMRKYIIKVGVSKVG